MLSMLDAQELIECYRKMLLIRRFEERMEKVFLKGAVSGTCHTCIGQEATAVGACAAIEPTDYVVSNHRGHGHFIAKGGDVKRIMAEMYGKVDGYSRGRGGSQHMADFGIGFLGSNGITGGGLPIATGAALAVKRQGKPAVVLAFLGDGAANQGAFHEALNMAALWKLPIVYVCENNLYAMSTPFADAFAIDRIAVRAESYGMPGVTADGNDLLTIVEETKVAADRARAGDGPTLVELMTYRQSGHSRGDPRVYRTREEEAEWAERCAIERLRRHLAEIEALDDEHDAEVKASVEQELDEAEAFACASPVDDVERLEEGVFA